MATESLRPQTARWMIGIGVMVLSVVGAAVPLPAQDWEGFQTRLGHYRQRREAYERAAAEFVRQEAAWAARKKTDPAAQRMEDKLKAAVEQSGLTALQRADLFRRAQAGDEAAQEQLVEEFIIRWRLTYALMIVSLVEFPEEWEAFRQLDALSWASARAEELRAAVERDRRQLLAEHARLLEAERQRRAQLQEELARLRESLALQRALIESQARLDLYRWAAEQIGRSAPRPLSCTTFSAGPWGWLTCY